MAGPQDEDASGPPGDEAGGQWLRRWGPVVAAVVVVLAGVGVALALTVSSSPTSPAGPEGPPLQSGPALASPDTTASGAPVDGITCRTASDQTVRYHIHIHVNIFVNGRQVLIPAGAGIPAPRLVEHLADGVFMDNSLNGCLYWLHVHTYDGIIHVESPYKSTFTLGQFFDIWQQPLGRDQVGAARGTVVAFVNGTRFTGSPRDVPLLPHAVVQLDVGSPVVPFQPVQFKVIGLCSGTQSCAAA